MIGEANILNRFSNIPMEEIHGLRAPFLEIGWNRQFLMMQEFGFLYDSSIVAPFSDPPFWPYTLNYKVPHNTSGELIIIVGISSESYDQCFERAPVNKRQSSGAKRGHNFKKTVTLLVKIS